MSAHAAAMVKWEVFRPSGGTGGAAAYDYGSDQKQLLDRVGDGGTLWLITSTRKGKAPRRYHLAYKLVDCVPIPPEKSVFSMQWKYVVRARDWECSRHFGYNDATSTLRRLNFKTGKPMSEVSNMGLKLLSVPKLRPEDVDSMRRLQHKIENARAVFISYCREDSALVATIESELEVRDVTVSRDVAILHPGQEWEDALRREVEATDCFLVLVSPAAAKSEWVRREVQWALREFKTGGLVRSIVPVVHPDGGWDRFPELNRFEFCGYPADEMREEVFDRLARGIVLARSES